MTTPALTAALKIFRELGWQQASAEQALELPLGTPEQRKTALAGLRSGPWGGYEPVESDEDPVGGTGFRALAWASWVGSDESMLTLFAIRLGVNARRAGELLHHTGPLEPDAVAAVLAERGAAFANAVIATGQVRSDVAVRLVIALDLPVPEVGDYPAIWARWGSWQLSPRMYGQRPGQAHLIAAKFVEHVDVAVAVGVPPAHGLADVIRHGRNHGWIGRDQTVTLAFAGLNAAQRPWDRKGWLQVLDDLAIADQELLDRADALVPLLAMGESALVERLGPVLIGGVDEAGLADVALSCLTAPTKKATVVVLKALAARSLPSVEVREAVAEQVAVLAGGRDAAVAKAAAAVIAAWRLADLVAPVDEQAASAGGWWQATPPVWTLPRFERGEVSAQALVELVAKVMASPSSSADVEVERLLVVANALARTDAAATRAAFQGVSGWGLWVQWITDWRDGTRTDPIFDGSTRFLAARAQAVMLALDELPCVLSEPSFVDLSVTATDLASRLRSYVQEGASARASDLFLAVCRLDAREVPAGVVAELQTLAVPVIGADGQQVAGSAGEVVAAYLADPVGEAQVAFVDREGWWKQVLPVMPSTFAPFKVQWSGERNYYGDYTFAVFPAWGDAGLVGGSWSADIPPELGVVHRQLARRREPLTPGLAINLLAGPRNCHQHALAEATQAVLEAWARGLLRPGVADVGLLDWRRPPTAVAALTAVLLEFAEAGLASVVWPVLDQLLVAAVNAPKLVAGASEVAEAMLVLVPEVLAAVADGRADVAVVNVPGVRALAARSGSSKAVTAAREVVAALPVVAAPAAVVSSPVPVLDPPFEVWWDARDPAVIEDGVTVRAEWIDPSSSTRTLRFDLALPDRPDVRYSVVKGWTYDLENEGQCAARQHAVGADWVDGERVWLRWDHAAQTMLVAPQRWVAGTQQVVTDGSTPTLSSSLLTVAVGVAAQDGDNGLVGRRLVAQLVEDGHLGPSAVSVAVVALLHSPAVSPAKLVGALAKAPHLLGALWPMLTEPVRAAGTVEGPLPSWLNLVLDSALRLAPYLREAASRGLLGESSTWPGLAEVAGRGGSSASVTKARRLLKALDLPSS
ncbi:MAG: hypothetical protein LWW77_03250 [Propionibacteriales bacterium]|nr:hypothetical protein [Propionibacteriales bacterium]